MEYLAEWRRLKSPSEGTNVETLQSQIYYKNCEYPRVALSLKRASIQTSTSILLSLHVISARAIEILIRERSIIADLLPPLENVEYFSMIVLLITLLALAVIGLKILIIYQIYWAIRERNPTATGLLLLPAFSFGLLIISIYMIWGDILKEIFSETLYPLPEDIAIVTNTFSIKYN